MLPFNDGESSELQGSVEFNSDAEFFYFNWLSANGSQILMTYLNLFLEKTQDEDRHILKFENYTVFGHELVSVHYLLPYEDDSQHTIIGYGFCEERQLVFIVFFGNYNEETASPGFPQFLETFECH